MKRCVTLAVWTNKTSIIFASTASVRDLCRDGNELLTLAQKSCDTERRSSCKASSQRLLIGGVRGDFSAFLATKETSRINFDPASRSMCLFCFACVLGVGLNCFETLSLRLTMSSDWKQFFAAAGLEDFLSDVCKTSGLFLLW